MFTTSFYSFGWGVPSISQNVAACLVVIYVVVMGDIRKKSVSSKRPILRYHGGKWLLAPWIIAHFPSHRLYVEPFCGAASVLVRKPRSEREIISDVDADVVQVLVSLRDDAAALLSRLHQLRHDQQHLELVQLFSDDPMERAARMIARSVFGRASASATSPWALTLRGAGQTQRDMQAEWLRKLADLPRASARLQSVTILKADAPEMIKKLDSMDTLFYLDPPYLSSTRDNGADYRAEMSHYDHARLLFELQMVKGAVVISGYRSELYHEMLDRCGWVRLEKATFSDQAQPRQEAIWLNQSAVRGIR